MNCIREIVPGILSVGAGDRRLALFENMFPLDNGVTYNSYLILDGKTALIDTVDATVMPQFLENLEAGLNGRALEYLVVNHMEPDHCAAIEEVCLRHPETEIVGNRKTFAMIGQFFESDLSRRFHEVKEGDELPLGKRTLQFVMTPMVHWPEAMFTLLPAEGILFSADAFGTFGGFNGALFSDETDFEHLYLDEARRYYSNIVGKYGRQVLDAFAKLGGAVPSLICPLHGPILRGAAIPLMLEKYRLWAAYEPERRGVVVAYASMYGNTASAAQALADMLAKRGVTDVRIFDVSKTNRSYIIAEIFRYSHIVVAAPTYNTHIYATMEALLADMAALNVQNRKVAVIGNGTWVPTSQKLMKEMLEKMKNVEVLGEPLTLLSSMKAAQIPAMEALADAIAVSVRQGA